MGLARHFSKSSAYIMSCSQAWLGLAFNFKIERVGTGVRQVKIFPSIVSFSVRDRLRIERTWLHGPTWHAQGKVKIRLTLTKRGKGPNKRGKALILLVLKALILLVLLLARATSKWQSFSKYLLIEQYNVAIQDPPPGAGVDSRFAKNHPWQKKTFVR